MQNSRSHLGRIAMSGVVSVALLNGCATGPMSTSAGRIGTDDGTDSCRRELVALDSTGNFFAADIVTGALAGAAVGALVGGLTGGARGAAIGAVGGGLVGGGGAYAMALQKQSRDQAGINAQIRDDLMNEGAQINKTQIALDQLTICRYYQAAGIKQARASGRLTRPEAVAQLDVVKQRAAHDLQLATYISGRIQGRSVEFDDTAERYAPGTKAAVASARPPPRTVTVRRAAAVKLTPSGSAPDLAQIGTRERVTVKGTRDGYALVETSNGTRGYTPISDLQGVAPAAAARPTSRADASAAVRTLAGSNAARRDDLTESIDVSSAAVTKLDIAT